jgi:diaminohydroxyphosphoribosylaminopyrimidine deaminase/5-amino-6-(5-phosphoribosylamino)uracil reductase
MPTKRDLRWLDAAARLAARARPLSRPNPGVAALLVRDGRLIARGWTQKGGRPHAEAAALAEALRTNPDGAAGAHAYVTLEPCAHLSERGPSCTQSLIEAKLGSVTIGLEDPDPRTAGQGAESLREAGITVQIADHGPSRDSLRGYLTQTLLGRPHVTLKLALSLDGKIALENGESQWITGKAARSHVHARRAECDAILVGGGTWRADNPSLDVRLPGLEAQSPQRVLLTRGVAPDGVKIINQPDQIASLSECQWLYVEGGAQTASSFLKADLVDRLEIYRAPIILGKGRDAIGDLELSELASAHGRWHAKTRAQLGSDTFEAYDRIRSSAP